MKTIHWAILGTGRVARKFTEAIPAAPGAALYAVGSRDIARAEAFARQYAVPAAYGSYGELIKDGEVDAVYIATPNTEHCENAIMCLERGKPVLCEKPMAVNASQERRMADAARANGVFLMEAMWTRFLPSIAHVRELLASGAIGELRTLNADFSFSVPRNCESRLFNPALGGGGLLDVGIYLMELSSMLFGPKPLRTSSYANIGPTGVDETAAMLLEYPGGCHAALTCGVHAYGTDNACIVGTEGRIELKTFHKSQSLRVVRRESSEDLQFPFKANGFEYEIKEATDCIRKGLLESPLMPLEESIAVMETMDGFRESWGLKYPMETGV